MSASPSPPAVDTAPADEAAVPVERPDGTLVESVAASEMKERSWATALGWTAGDRWFFAVVSAVMLAALTVHMVRRSGWGLKPITIHRPADRVYEFQLDVNKATWVEWMQLEGIGETLARRIVDDREKNGPFQTVEDVSQVKGVGDATLAKIKPWLRIETAQGK